MDDLDLFEPMGFAFQEFMMNDDDDDRPRRRPSQSSRGDGSENPPCPICGVTLRTQSDGTLICPRCNREFRVR